MRGSRRIKFIGVRLGFHGIELLIASNVAEWREGVSLCVIVECRNVVSPLALASRSSAVLRAASAAPAGCGGRGKPSAMCRCAARASRSQLRLESDDVSRRRHSSQVLSAGGRRSAALSAAVHLDARPCPLAPGAVSGTPFAPLACGDPSSHRSPAEGHYAVSQWAIRGQSVGHQWAISS